MAKNESEVRIKTTADTSGSDKVKKSLDEVGDSGEKASKKTDGGFKKLFPTFSKAGGAIKGLAGGLMSFVTPAGLATAAIGFVVAKVRESIKEFDAAQERAQALAAQGIDVARASYEGLVPAVDKAIRAGELLSENQEREIKVIDEKTAAIDRQKARLDAKAESDRALALAEVDLAEETGKLSKSEADARRVGINESGISAARKRDEDALKRKASVADAGATSAARDAEAIRAREAVAATEVSDLVNNRGSARRDLAPDLREKRDLAQAALISATKKAKGGILDGGPNEEEEATIKLLEEEYTSLNKDLAAEQQRIIDGKVKRLEALRAEGDAAQAVVDEQLRKANAAKAELNEFETSGATIFEQDRRTRSIQRETQAARQASPTTPAPTGNATAGAGAASAVSGYVDSVRPRIGTDGGRNALNALAKAGQSLADGVTDQEMQTVIKEFSSIVTRLNGIQAKDSAALRSELEKLQRIVKNDRR